jgi:hypothetical protein
MHVAATASDTEVTFLITDLENGCNNNVIRFYTAAGLVNAWSSFATVCFPPNLLLIEPNTGSAGGALLRVTGSGFGIKDTVTLVDSSDNDLCQTSTVTGYGTFTCLTKAQEITEATMFIRVGTNKVGCHVETESTEWKCKYKQLTADSPTVTSFAVTDATTMTVTGTNFVAAGHTAKVTVQGVESSSCTISADGTTITATFSNGLPVGSSAMTPVVQLTPTARRMLSGGSTVLYTLAANSGATVTNSFTLTSSTSGLECSFSGGCAYSVTGTGLTATLLAPNTQDNIDVCGNKCVVD